VDARADIVVVGAGPAGLMAAEAASAFGARVDVFEAMASGARKFLLAGKGGLNLTHGEPLPAFVTRYGLAQVRLAALLADFGPDRLRAFAADLGIDTFVGSSGRVFPRDMKAAPFLRRWLHRLRERGVRFHVRRRWRGWHLDGALHFSGPDGDEYVTPRATVLALGGGSWPQLGSDGAWQPLLAARGVPVAPLQPSNCGFESRWSEHFVAHHAGAAVKPVAARCVAPDGTRLQQRGEFVVSAYGVEGSLIYALSAPLRELIARDGRALLELDLLPDHPPERVAALLARPRGKRTVAEWLKRSLGLSGVKAGLLREALPREAFDDPARVARCVKALPLTLHATRPLAESISSAGGVRFEGLDEHLMLHALPGVFCAGEMIDWEAPTGGYLLTASFSTGHRAGRAAAAYGDDAHPGWSDGAAAANLAP